VAAVLAVDDRVGRSLRGPYAETGRRLTHVDELPEGLRELDPEPSVD
jgi:hypothetical protein